MTKALRVKKLYSDAQLPVRANPTDSGLDVFVHHFEQYISNADKFPLDQEFVRLQQGSCKYHYN